MKISGNVILVTGGGSGIGLALAQALQSADNEVYVAGRSEEKLEKARALGLKTVAVDMRDRRHIESMAQELVKKATGLNIVIHNAGIMKNEKLTSGHASAIACETIETNVLGPIYLTNALLPHFLKQPAACIVTVTSGLAYVPLAMTPTYSASKAAIHAYTESLRYQLKDTAVEVKELIPPYVRTALMGDRQARDENAMPLDAFIQEVMTIWREQPQAPEIRVSRVLPQRTAAHEGFAKYDEFFKRQNDTLMTARKKEWDAL